MSDIVQSGFAAEPDLCGLGMLRLGRQLSRPSKAVMAREAGRTFGGWMQYSAVTEPGGS